MQQRVEIPAWADQWMQGDRFGEVVRTKRVAGPEGDETLAYINLDKTGRTVRFYIDELKVI